MAAPRDPFNQHDDLNEDREILDIIPERFDSDPDSRYARRAAHTRLILTVSLAVLAVMALGVAARHILFGETPKDHQASVPVIHAEDKPIKVKPQDRGGMDVPNQDKLIYDRMAAKKDDQQAERLLPPPEQAQTPPAAPEKAAPSAPVPSPAPGPAPAPTPAPSITAPAPAVTAPLPAKPVPSPSASAPMPAPAKPQPAPAPQPSPPPAAKAAPAPAPAAPAPAAAPAATAKAGGGWVVQLGSLPGEAEAKAEWNHLKSAHHQLADLQPDIQRVDLGAKGVHWRVRGGPLDEATARVLCADLTKQGQGCLVAKK